MENLNIDLDVLKFDGAFIMAIKGKATTKRCVCIPIEENDIYVSKDDATGKPKAAYVHLTAWKAKEERFGQTHYVKQSLSKEFKEKYPDKAKDRLILGNGKPADVPNNNAAASVNVPAWEADLNSANDLPF